MVTFVATNGDEWNEIVWNRNSRSSTFPDEIETAGLVELCIFAYLFKLAPNFFNNCCKIKIFN